MLPKSSCIVIFLICFLMSPAIKAQPEATPLSERLANYEMNVSLDVENRLIDGTEILTWKNNTTHPTSQMQFHLYYNAWFNEHSSQFYSVRKRRNFRENLSDYRENDWAYNKVQSIRILNSEGWTETNISATMKYIQPDDGNKNDRTVMQVSLPKPVNPGETIRLEIQWELKIPRTFARTGARDDYFFIAQWFPKVGVFEADGEWNCHQFIQTEFYADFGVYDVKMTVPSGWIVGATGTEIEKTENNDHTTTHRFYQEDVHDFAWVTSPHFSVHNEIFSEPDLPAVHMRLLLMPDHANKKDRYFLATRQALKYYGSWWGAYPYNHITVVDPAYKSDTGGMEYPTIFTGGTRWFSPIAFRSPESVTIHEAGHQFWYGIIANDEFEHAWLDEGFNTYSTTRTLEQTYPNRVLTKRYFEGFIPVVFPSVKVAERTQGADSKFGFYSLLKRDKISTLSWKYGPEAYGYNSYEKPAMMLRTLENYLGWETFQKIMSAYFARWKFRHPKPEDFFAVVNEVSGKDMSWFFEQTYNSSNIFDYGVGLVESRLMNEAKGYHEVNDGWIYKNGEEVLDDSETLPERTYASRVFIRRWGEAIFPIEIKITFDNGDEIWENWDSKSRWKRFDYQKNARVQKVEIDPLNKLVLDVNHTNNTWIRESHSEIAAAKWASKWMIWLQHLMEFFAFFS